MSVAFIAPADVTQGQVVTAVIRGRVTSVHNGYFLVDAGSGPTNTLVAHENVESVSVHQEPKDFYFGSVIWVEVIGERGTCEVVVVKNAAGERRYRGIQRPVSFTDDELGVVTGVNYKAFDFSEAPF